MRKFTLRLQHFLLLAALVLSAGSTEVAGDEFILEGDVRLSREEQRELSSCISRRARFLSNGNLFGDESFQLPKFKFSKVTPVGKPEPTNLNYKVFVSDYLKFVREEVFTKLPPSIRRHVTSDEAIKLDKKIIDELWARYSKPPVPAEPFLEQLVFERGVRARVELNYLPSDFVPIGPANRDNPYYDRFLSASISPPTI